MVLRNMLVIQLNKTREPKTYFEASKYSHWIDAMNQEMNALLRNGTWELIDLPEGKKAIGSKWIYKIKFTSSGEIDIKLDWLLKAPRQWNAKLTSTLIENGFSQSKSDYSLYSKSDKGCVLPCCFMWMILSLLRKSVLDLLSEYGMLACKPAKAPLMSKLVISNEASVKDHLLENITDYQKLMGKLIYLTNTRPYISYVVHCLSQFMHSPLTSHLKIAFKILRYLKSCPGLGVHIYKTSGMFLTSYSEDDWAKCVVTRKSITGYCVFLNNSFIS
nr:ribonuclease H-like domain-containing protein [Tanacetum cinerariifolium]